MKLAYQYIQVRVSKHLKDSVLQELAERKAEETDPSTQTGFVQELIRGYFLKKDRALSKQTKLFEQNPKSEQTPCNTKSHN